MSKTVTQINNSSLNFFDQHVLCLLYGLATNEKSSGTRHKNNDLLHSLKAEKSRLLSN